MAVKDQLPVTGNNSDAATAVEVEPTPAGQIAPADPKVAQQRISLYTRILSGEAGLATNLTGSGAPSTCPLD